MSVCVCVRACVRVRAFARLHTSLRECMCAGLNLVRQEEPETRHILLLRERDKGCDLRQVSSFLGTAAIRKRGKGCDMQGVTRQHGHTDEMQVRKQIRTRMRGSQMRRGRGHMRDCSVYTLLTLVTGLFRRLL